MKVNRLSREMNNLMKSCSQFKCGECMELLPCLSQSSERAKIASAKGPKLGCKRLWSLDRLVTNRNGDIKSKCNSFLCLGLAIGIGGIQMMIVMMMIMMMGWLLTNSLSSTNRWLELKGGHD